MALSLLEYRAELLETINQLSSDSNIDYRYLDSLIMDKRELYFMRTYNRFNNSIPSIYYQTLPCVEVIDVDQAECCSITTGCYIKRTKDKIPPFVHLSDGELIEKVGPTFIVTVPFNIIPYRRAEYFGTGKYDKKAIAAFLYNGYLYLISNNKFEFELLEFINIRGIFRNPMEAGRFKDCDGKPCFSPLSIYPLEGKLWEYIKKDILGTELKIKLTTPTDNEGDNEDNLTDPLK